MSDREQLLRELEQQALNRQAAQTEAQKAMSEIETLLPKAIAAGASKREIARRTGISRTWIDELLRRD